MHKCLLCITNLRGGGGGGGRTWVRVCCWHVLLGSQNPYPIIVYSVANYRLHVSHFWVYMQFWRSQISHYLFICIVKIPIESIGAHLPTPRYGQYLTHAHNHITRVVAAMDSCFALVGAHQHGIAVGSMTKTLYCRGECKHSFKGQLHCE